MNARIVSQLLRAPEQVARECVEERRLPQLALVSISAIALGGALFGATVGGYRGGLQVLYSAIKVPAACLWTLALCVPAYYAFTNIFGRALPVRVVAALTLASIARASLVLLAAVPVIWLMVDMGASYHATALWASVAYGLAGLSALGVMLRALGDRSKRFVVAGLMVSLFCIVGGQSAWIMRPYLGRPSQAEVPFLRAPDGVFAERVWKSGRSSMGWFDEEHSR